MIVVDEHPKTVILAMETIMVVLLEESEDIGEDLLHIVLSVLGRDKKDITTAARRLAMNVIGQCAGKLEPGIKQFILSSMSGDSSPSNPQIDYHEVIYDIYQCAPHALSRIVSYLTQELQTDNVELRLKAVRLVGDLFSLQGSTIPQSFHPVFLEFLKRSNDKVIEVQMSVLERVKLCLSSDPFRAEAPQLVAALSDRLLDCDESIRKQAVAVVSDVASLELSSISADTIKLVAERLQDKSVLVKKYTMERLSGIYQTWCSKQIGGLNLDYDWIPGRILRCFYDKDFGPDTVEHILCTSLFPVELSVRDKVRNWVRLFSKFDKVEVKALEKILEQKQRSQLELQKYLSLRQMYKDGDASELLKKVTHGIRLMSHSFVDPIKAEADLQLLDQLKDVNIWKILTTLLDPNTSSLQSRSFRDELLKIVGEKHPLYELLNTLSMKCSYIIFDMDFVKDLLLETDLQKCAGNRVLTQSCMNILVIIACFSPLLLSGIEEDLVRLLEDDDEAIKEGVLHVLAKAGGMIREQLGESSSTLDLILERICLEGSRTQAKYAVHALAAITKDDGLKSLSVLYKRLVDMLEKRTHLPTVLQSLGCIAQMAMPVFETQESKIKCFIRKDILRCSQKTGDKAKQSWDDRSELCSLKIFGIKVLVKSYLPVKDGHLRVGIDELIKDLQSILSFGEISKDVESSAVDKAHLKLASAKAIIRLSKHWDKKIPVNVFHLTLRTSEVGFPKVMKQFLTKVHQYIKDGSLDLKYICAFLSDFGSQTSIPEEEKHLSDIIQMSRQGKAQELSMQTDGNSLVVQPEYILPYLVHALAHHPSCPNVDECKDIKAYEPIYRKLYKYFSMFALGDEDGKPGVGLKKEEIILIVSVLQNIKNSKDAVDATMSKNSYAICDLCLSITKRLAQKQEDLLESVVPVSLPQVLYTPYKKKEEKEEENKEDEKKEENKEHEKKEEIDMEVTEGRTWLADESALAHFESLILEANGSVPSKSNEVDMVKDSETDGNEVPLGKMLKRLKAKGSQARKAVKNDSTPVVETENNVDILGMLREINLDNLGVSNQFDSSNGHGKVRNEAKLKRKNLPNDLTNVSVPKRRRSSSAKGHKRSSFLKGGFKGRSAFGSIIMNDDPHSRLELKGLIHVEETRHTDDIDLEKPKKSFETGINLKSGHVKKRKRRRVSGLAKCTLDETKTNPRDLIGRRIKVWWPMDKAFYGGVVKSYDHQKKKHVVLYDDGDIEVLYLDKERWELVEDEHKPKKRKLLSNSPPPKGGSSKKKIKSLGSSKQTKESTDISPSSMIRGKRTPRKNFKRGQKGVSQGTAYSEMVRSIDADTSMPEAEPQAEAKPTTFSEVGNLDAREEEPLSNGQGGSSAGLEDSDKVEKSRSEEKQVKDAESSSSDTVCSHENEPDSGQKETENVDTILEDGSESDENHKKEKRSPDEIHESDSSGGNEDRKGSTCDDSNKPEFSDDEPLGAWKSRVGKSVEDK
ncbi:sister chromatid cohesion protein PDS5 homolog B-like isoform X2 [Cynara cardunculus var. scolymus]|uniref:sister chromatid cohesion protein PDS5 homolog B-like isoform X2 n=1 Tax=Cynara cardunculus var. scolymus TaxID=59895 RepID=UPI000D625465|nr:sister chromatid cohesion protein PDS5 homolog B-like isoform X2 [Cynara cardunculus var. scolymus]